MKAFDPNFINKFSVPPRQLLVLQETCFNPRTARELAGDLGISVSGVKAHMRELYKRFSVKNKAQLLVKCVPYIITMRQQ